MSESFLTTGFIKKNLCQTNKVDTKGDTNEPS